jgi:flagella basal body P-ring formation protein FlgA
VTAIWQDGPLRVVVTGIATNTAAIGAPVGVRIDPTRRLDGIAAGPNTVRLR